MRLDEAFDMFANEYVLPKGQGRKRARDVALVKRELVELIGNKKLNKFTVADSARYNAHLLDIGNLPSTVFGKIVTVRGVLRYASLRGYKCINYELIAVPKRQKAVPVHLDADEVQMLIDAAERPRDKFMISLLFASGVRVAELCKMNRGQIHDGQFTIVGKGNKRRICFVDHRTLDLQYKYLETRTDGNHALFLNVANENRINTAGVERVIRQVTNKAGLNKRVTPHTLRHSFATNFLQNNGNMRYLKDLLGHASMDTTQIYAHVVDNDLRRQYLQHHSV